MTVDPSSLLTISIGTIVALIGVVVAATATWTRLGMRLDALAASMKELRSWHLKATASARDELDDAVEAFRSRHHQHSTRMQGFELRLARLEDRTGIPAALASDPTPVVSEPAPRRRPRVAAAQELESDS